MFVKNEGTYVCVTSMRKERRIFYICQEKNKDKGNTWEKVKKSEK